MSTLEISKRFSLDAAPDQVFSYLLQPSLVVGCLPGAALSESSEDGLHHSGTIRVKLGALGVSYRGNADFVEVDRVSRRLRVEGKGREKSGAGAVSMSMTTDVVARGSGAEVRVDVQVQLAGKIVSFGRGMVGAVADEVLSSFAECLSARLSESHAAGGEPTGSPPDDDEPPGLELSLLVRAAREWLRRRLGGSA